MKHLLFSLIFFTIFGFSVVYTAEAVEPQIPPGITIVKTYIVPGTKTTKTEYSDGSVLTVTPNEPNPPIMTYITADQARNTINPKTGQSTQTLPPQKTSTNLDSSNTNTTVSAPSSVSFLDRIIPLNSFAESLNNNPLNKIFNQLFYLGLIVAVVLAVIMIIRGGIEYMTIDAIASKESGKKRVQAALGGLLLAFSAVLILNTINPNITSLKIVFPTLSGVKETNIEALKSIPRLGAGTVIPIGGNYGAWEEYTAEDWVRSLPNGVRSTDGRLVFTTYSATGDAITDSNTAVKRGNKNNLLREGSVALSPDLINQYNPKHGAEVFINGVSVGFYEDTTASEYNGVQFRNTVDVYDENQTLGSKLKNIPAGQWEISFGAPRPQISNP